MKDIFRLTATEAGSKIRAGKLTSEGYVRACLERIRARDPEVAAWQFVDPEHAIAQARARDKERPRGLLHGVPVAFKDIVDTADLPTGYGSLVNPTHRPAIDAVCVALARQAGAVVMGKTVSTEYAVRHPGKTRNPLDLSRTPGGSSSGSAAAVADGQVTLATGSQTAGSTIRPGAYCGVHAFKPTYGIVPMTGIKVLSATFDTMGLFARALDDLQLFRDVLVGADKPSPHVAPPRKPRIGFCRTPAWKKTDTATQRHLTDAAKRLAKAGATVADVELPKGFENGEAVIWRIIFFEMARNLAPEWRERRENLSPWIRNTIAEALKTPMEAYLEALAEVQRLREAARDVLSGFDVFMAPAAPGEAPVGVLDTGPPTFQVPWHLLGMPALTLPLFTGAKGMPIGLQLVGHPREDDRLFAAARWVERKLS